MWWGIGEHTQEHEHMGGGVAKDKQKWKRKN